MTTRTAIFGQYVRDFMRPAPVCMAQDNPISDAVGAMTAQKASCVVVIDETRRPVGILTEQDIVRRVAIRADGNEPIRDLMTKPVRTIEESQYLYYAISRMRRDGVRHMPVVDRDGFPVGLIDRWQALAAVAAPMIEQIESLTREDSIDGLTQVKAAQVDLVVQLMEDKLPVEEIQSLLTHINNDIYRRVVNLNLIAMAEDGLGEPPVPFNVIVMGSGGRGENYIYPDQDNGFIIEDYPDDRHTEIDGWFIELAERMTRDLDIVGLPLCKGHVMATNPLWRKTRSQWRQQITRWSRKRGSTALRLSDIFFDFRSSWGSREMSEELRHHVTLTARDNPLFLRELFEDDKEAGVALGWFGRFIVEKENKEHKGKLGLKHSGTLPVVQSIRLLALREGIEEIGTLQRMAALHRVGVISDDEFDYLKNGFRHICSLLLRQQVADYKAGLMVSNYVDPKNLTTREKDILHDSFKAIHGFRERVRAEFTGDVF